MPPECALLHVPRGRAHVRRPAGHVCRTGWFLPPLSVLQHGTENDLWLAHCIRDCLPDRIVQQVLGDRRTLLAPVHTPVVELPVTRIADVPRAAAATSHESA